MEQGAPCLPKGLGDVKYQELADLDLLALVGAGREEALEALYQRHARRVFTLAFGILRDRASAEEATEEVFLRVWRNASTYDTQRGQFTTWLLSIAHHRAVDLLRHRRASSGRDEEMPAEEMQDPGIDLPERASESIEGEQVRRAMAALPPEQREVLHLAYFQGYTQSEIARRLGAPLGTVKTRIRLGIQKLREALAPQGEARHEM
ncbi:MAG: sigma-70 family RNA polymerase sigma factor [Chloroflexi bacterium]|nr:sigma-70 family RNA polymerase sigma factor [Chloroflexota bacterium]